MRNFGLRRWLLLFALTTAVGLTAYADDSDSRSEKQKRDRSESRKKVDQEERERDERRELERKKEAEARERAEIQRREELEKEARIRMERARRAEAEERARIQEREREAREAEVREQETRRLREAAQKQEQAQLAEMKREADKKAAIAKERAAKEKAAKQKAEKNGEGKRPGRPEDKKPASPKKPKKTSQKETPEKSEKEAQGKPVVFEFVPAAPQAPVVDPNPPTLELKSEGKLELKLRLNQNGKDIEVIVKEDGEKAEKKIIAQPKVIDKVIPPKIHEELKAVPKKLELKTIEPKKVSSNEEETVVTENTTNVFGESIADIEESILKNPPKTSLFWNPDQVDGKFVPFVDSSRYITVIDPVTCCAIYLFVL